MKAKLFKYRFWIAGIAAAILIVGAATFAYVGSRSKPNSVTASKGPAKVIKPPEPKTLPSPLTGVQVDPSLAHRPVTAVIIENQIDARPQSGLSQAGVVYEALAEGGITRFLAFYQDGQAGKIGPVRSVRTYFVDWALEFGAPVAHAGGNVDALDLIGPLGMKNMDGLYNGPSSAFYRVSDRYAPHNFYTSSSALDKLEQQLGYYQPSSFTPSPRKTDTPEATASHPVIKLNYSYNGYQVEYDYDAAHNDYVRFLDGVPHIDRETGQQLRTKNLVIEIMPTSYGLTRLGEQTVIMQTVGQGRALVFRDGGVVEGTWRKTSHNARTLLLDANGAEIPLDAGSTWYGILPPDRSFSY